MKRAISICCIAMSLSFISEAQENQPNRINMRALLCEPIEFSELNSLDFSELEGMYCSSYSAAMRAFDRAAVERSNDPRRNLAIDRETLAFTATCKRIFMPASDIAKRKFDGKKFDCSWVRLPDRK